MCIKSHFNDENENSDYCIKVKSTKTDFEKKLFRGIITDIEPLFNVPENEFLPKHIYIAKAEKQD